MANNGFTRLPPVLLEDIHQRVVHAGGVATAMAFETSCKEINQACRSFRLKHVTATRHRHGIALFERWNAAHGHRVDALHLALGNVTAYCPPLTSYNIRATSLSLTVHLASSLAPLAAHPHLTELRIERLSSSACVPLCPLATLGPTLRALSLNIAPGAVPSLLPLAALTCLTSLELRSLAICRTLHILARMPPTLRRLTLVNGPNISNLDPLSRCTALTHLTLDTFPQLESLEPLAPLLQLQHLRLAAVSCSADLQPLCFMLPSLRSLDVRACSVPYVEHLVTLGGGQLQALRLHDCDCSPNLAPISTLTALTSLDLHALRPPAQHLRFLPPLVALKFLRLSCASTLSDLTPLAPLSALTHLELSARAATSLTPLAALTALQALALDHCRAPSLGPLQGLSSLEQIRCKSLHHVTSICPLAKLPRLHKVDLTDCPLVQEQTLPPLHRAFSRSCSCK